MSLPHPIPSHQSFLPSKPVPFSSFQLHSSSFLPPSQTSTHQKIPPSSVIHPPLSLPPSCHFALLYENWLLKPFSSLRLQGDLILFEKLELDEDGETRGVLAIYNQYKTISHISIDYKSLLLTVKLQSRIHNFSSTQEMKERLLRLNCPDASKLALLLDNYEEAICQMRASLAREGREEREGEGKGERDEERMGEGEDKKREWKSEGILEEREEDERNIKINRKGEAGVVDIEKEIYEKRRGERDGGRIKPPNKRSLIYKNFVQSIESLIIKWKDFPMLGMKLKFQESSMDLEVDEIFLNESYSNTIFENVMDCVSSLQEKGLPDSFIPTGNYFEFVRQVLTSTFLKEKKEKKEEKEEEKELGRKRKEEGGKNEGIWRRGGERRKENEKEKITEKRERMKSNGSKMKVGTDRKKERCKERWSIDERERVEQEWEEEGKREIRIPTKIVDKFGCKMKGYTLAKFFCFRNENYAEFVTLYFFIGEKNKAAGKKTNNILNKRKAMEGVNEQFMSMFYPDVLKRLKIEAEGKVCDWRPIQMT